MQDAPRSEQRRDVTVDTVRAVVCSDQTLGVRITAEEYDGNLFGGKTRLNSGMTSGVSIMTMSLRMAH
jgi:hypothetical protein